MKTIIEANVELEEAISAHKRKHRWRLLFVELAFFCPGYALLLHLADDAGGGWLNYAQAIGGLWLVQVATAIERAREAI